MYCRSEICIAAPKYILSLQNRLSRRHAHVSKPSLYSTIWATPHERVHNGLVLAPRPLIVLIPGSHHVPPLVPTRRKVLSMSKTFAGSRCTRLGQTLQQNIFGLTLLQRCCNACVKRSHCNNRAIYERFQNFAATLY